MPPVVVDGFDHEHALTGIPVRRRPDWGALACPTCSGRGARNDLIHLDSMRCRLAACADCDGSGWLSADGTRHLPDVEMREGSPAWVVRIVPAVRRTLPPSLLPSAPVPDDLAAEYAEAA